MSFIPAFFRLGLLVGDPLGLTVASHVSDGFEAHGLIAHQGREPDALLFALDGVYQLPEIIGDVGDVGSIVTWFGAGLRYQSGVGTDDARFGVRVPFGLSYFDRRAPIELFVSLAVGSSFIPDADASLDLGIGMRVGL